MNILNSSLAALVGVSTAVSLGTFTLNKPAEASIVSRPEVAQVQSVDVPPPVAEPAVKPPVVVAVQPGDYLEKVAAENGTTTARLFAANAEIERPDIIYPGQQIRVPDADEVLPERAMPEPVIAAAEPVVADEPPVAQAPRTVRATRPVSSAPAVSDGSAWDRLAACEAGGNWSINTGNGYYGGLQFTTSSWRAVGGSGLPSDASREEQIMRGQMLQARQGWGAWPACSAKLGLS
ncbi:hypothetical protein BH09PAT3_BH09PAT3_6960 [soil metagenome]